MKTTACLVAKKYYKGIFGFVRELIDFCMRHAELTGMSHKCLFM